MDLQYSPILKQKVLYLVFHLRRRSRCRWFRCRWFWRDWRAPWPKWERLEYGSETRLWAYASDPTSPQRDESRSYRMNTLKKGEKDDELIPK